MRTSAWNAAPPDRHSTRFPDDIWYLDVWIRSPEAPIDERVAALERWVARRPNRVVLGSVPAETAGKYSPVGEYLRARLTDQTYLETPYSGTVWIALARSGWLGEWTAEKGVSSFTRSAAVRPEVLPDVAAAATRYIPEAKAHLCALFHGRAERAADVALRLALYAAIRRMTTP